MITMLITLTKQAVMWDSASFKEEAVCRGICQTDRQDRL